MSGRLSVYLKGEHSFAIMYLDVLFIESFNFIGLTLYVLFNGYWKKSRTNYYYYLSINVLFSFKYQVEIKVEIVQNQNLEKFNYYYLIFSEILIEFLKIFNNIIFGIFFVLSNNSIKLFARIQLFSEIM